ncbi:MAG: DUF389 domain-containing protein [Bacteroidaceae bacterium]|nr:DUF389 domain-containing protein [Bacteroidaceae bacterium]
MNIKDLLERARVYFNLMPDKEDEETVACQISSGVSFRGANLWVLIFAILIASLGLNVNSTAVIIGAMLISPLMGPILGIGLALGTYDLALLGRAAKNYGIATLISILTATVYFLLSPFSEVQSELLARTSPTLYDVLIAFCGGAAGIIAICTNGKGNVIPGVAIATALMPPLCTAGFGLATGNLHFFFGAFYLFLINTIFIALATWGGVRLLRFSQHEHLSAERMRLARRIIPFVILVILIPAALTTVHTVRESIFDRNVSRFIKGELTQTGTQIIQSSVDKETMKLRVVAVGRAIDEATTVEARRRMEHYSLGRYDLSIIQGAQTDSLMLLQGEINRMASSREAEHQRLLELSAEANALTQQLDGYTRYDRLAADVGDEMMALFPQVTSLSLALATEAVVPREGADTIATAATPRVIALVGTAEGEALTSDDAARLRRWLAARTASDSLVVIAIPAENAH